MWLLRNGIALALSGLLVISDSVISDPIYPKDIAIYFGNGILTQEQQAFASLRELRRKVENESVSLEVQSELLFDVAYNPTNSVLLDLFEAVRQLEDLNATRVWRIIAGIDEVSDTVAGEIIGFLADRMVEIAQNNTLANNPAVQQHVEKYNKLLEECKRVVVVAHSQGNLFANIAYTGIEPTLVDAFGIVSVANPDSAVAGGGPHTTIEEDIVINPIPGSLPANVDNYGFLEIPSPWYGHEFVGNYLDQGRPAEAKIVDDVLAMIEQLQQFDNLNYCGWPAVKGTISSVSRSPYDIEISDSGEISSPIWDAVWAAAYIDNLTIQYRLGMSGEWITLVQRRLTFGEGAATYWAPEFRDGWKRSPYVWISNINSVESADEPIVWIVQPFGVENAADVVGIQQYRLILDNAVIDQFTVDYYDPWNPVRTSRPISENLYLDGNGVPVEPYP